MLSTESNAENINFQESFRATTERLNLDTILEGVEKCFWPKELAIYENHKSGIHFLRYPFPQYYWGLIA